MYWSRSFFDTKMSGKKPLESTSIPKSWFNITSILTALCVLLSVELRVKVTLYFSDSFFELVSLTLIGLVYI